MVARRRDGHARWHVSQTAGRRRRLQRHIATVSLQVAMLLVIGTTIALTMAVACLLAIGPPPAVRLDALWVRQHELLVRVLVIAVVGAAVCSGPLLVSRRNRLLAVMMWLAFIVLCLMMFSDRILIIQRVLWQYAV